MLPTYLVVGLFELVAPVAAGWLVPEELAVEPLAPMPELVEDDGVLLLDGFDEDDEDGVLLLD